MRSLRFALADALKVVLLTLLVPLALLASMSDLVEAQELKPATSLGIQKSEVASPQALRTRKASIESELLQLRALLAEKKKALEEVKLMELEVSNRPDVPGGNALELVSRIARNAVSVSNELRPRAEAALNIDSTFRVNSSRRTRVQSPKECNPPTLTNTSSQTEINRVGDACLAAVKTILDERAKNPAPGPHQEINRVRTALEKDIEETSRKISSAEALVP